MEKYISQEGLSSKSSGACSGLEQPAGSWSVQHILIIPVSEYGAHLPNQTLPS